MSGEISFLSQIVRGGISQNAMIGALQPNAFGLFALLRETSGLSPVNVSLGSQSGLSDILPAVAVKAGCGTFVEANSFLQDWWSFKNPRPVWLNSVAWGNAKVNIALYYLEGP